VERDFQGLLEIIKIDPLLCGYESGDEINQGKNEKPSPQYP